MLLQGTRLSPFQISFPKSTHVSGFPSMPKVCVPIDSDCSCQADISHNPCNHLLALNCIIVSLLGCIDFGSTAAFLTFLSVGSVSLQHEKRIAKNVALIGHSSADRVVPKLCTPHHSLLDRWSKESSELPISARKIRLHYQCMVSHLDVNGISACATF